MSNPRHNGALVAALILLGVVCSGCSSTQSERSIAPAAMQDVAAPSHIASVRAMELALSLMPTREPEIMHVPFTARVQRMAEGWIVYIGTKDDFFGTVTVVVSDAGEVIGYDD